MIHINAKIFFFYFSVTRKQLYFTTLSKRYHFSAKIKHKTFQPKVKSDNATGTLIITFLQENCMKAKGDFQLSFVGN